jgi:cation transport ATPase
MNTQSDNDEKIEHILIKIRIKEEMRSVMVRKNDSLRLIKEREFPGVRSRIIYRGKELKDSDILSSLGILENEILHVVITTHQNDATSIHSRHQNERELRTNESDNNQLTFILYLVFLIMCMLGWMLAISLPQYFSLFSKILMALLTVVLCMLTMSKFLRVQP